MEPLVTSELRPVAYAIEAVAKNKGSVNIDISGFWIKASTHTWVSP
jgi:hypothetical protein